jgi:hypothetical protein
MTASETPCVCPVDLNGTTSLHFLTVETDGLLEGETHNDQSSMWKFRSDTRARTVCFKSRRGVAIVIASAANIDPALEWIRTA